jgi:NTE family protein
MTREKEIRYSSRTRAATDQFKYAQKLRHTLAGLIAKLPDDLRSSPEARLLGSAAERKVYNIVHLIFVPRITKAISKDYDFSRTN